MLFLQYSLHSAAPPLKLNNKPHSFTRACVSFWGCIHYSHVGCLFLLVTIRFLSFAGRHVFTSGRATDLRVQNKKGKHRSHNIVQKWLKTIVSRLACYNCIVCNSCNHSFEGVKDEKGFSYKVNLCSPFKCGDDENSVVS